MPLYIVNAPDVWELARLVSIFQYVLHAVAKERARMCMRLLKDAIDVEKRFYNNWKVK